MTISLHIHVPMNNLMCVFLQLSEQSYKNLVLAENVDYNDKQANIIYAETATQLFEGIAKIVEIRQPLVETYYGQCLYTFH